MSEAIAANLRVLAFDVFGTVVDWHGSVMREVENLLPGVDGNAFALAWRAGYAPAMQRVRAGELPWTLIDDLHRLILDDVLHDFGIRDLDADSTARLNRVWHHLDAWPDSVPGLTRLKSRYRICTLSNGNITLLSDMARHAGLPWDRILSAETFHHYKPDPETYLGVAREFGVEPAQVLMVAAHQSDMAGARACGLHTAYIERPREFGATQAKDVSPDPANTFHARDLPDLARQLGC